MRGVQVVATALGDDHPIARHCAALADANMNLATRQAILDRARAVQAEVAQRILDHAMPTRQDLDEARTRRAEASTPLLERVWALRNVAGSLGMGSEGERGKAREYLEQALALQRQHLGDAPHPGLLGELFRQGLGGSRVGVQGRCEEAC